ncbi:MAG: VanZ family protein [Muribaculaceae bacterium]
MDFIKDWFSNNIPMDLVLISVGVLCFLLVFVLLKLNGNKAKRCSLILLFIEYVFLILCVTVICRSTYMGDPIELIPFYTYPDIWNKVEHPRYLFEALMNVALFIPVGLLLAAIFHNKKCMSIVLIGAGISAIIELLQLFTGRGLCETDDLIHNTLGCAIGYGLFRLLLKLKIKLL